jgi:drug/metabolite transporter (DMT)-like permease
VISERVVADFGPVAAMFKAFVVASAFWIVYQLPRGWPMELIEADNILRVSFVGVAGTLAPFLLFVWGVHRVSAERASIAATLEPVFGAIVAWVWLGQSLSGPQIVGGLLVIGGVALLQARSREPLRAPEP